MKMKMNCVHSIMNGIGHLNDAGSSPIDRQCKQKVVSS